MSAEQDLANANVQIANLISEVTRFRDAAMGLNAIYPTITEGRQTVGDGEYFSVPGSGAYMRLYRRQGSSAELIAEFPDRAQVQSLVDTLGGRGVTNGLLNLGQENDLVRLSDAVFASRAKFGNYYATSAEANIDEAAAGSCGLYSVGGLGTYPGNDAFCWIETQSTFGGNALVQRACAYSSSTSTANLRPRSFIRICSNVLSGEGKRIWGPWAEIFTSQNILGAVSQSDGVPTGAIIERGSNANGEYVKFADGTLICHIQKNLGSIVAEGSGTTSDPYRTASANIGFPTTFNVVGDLRPQVVLHPQIFTSNLAEGDVRVTTSRPSSDGKNLGIVRVLRNSSDATDLDVWISVIVIGRWY